MPVSDLTADPLLATENVTELAVAPGPLVGPVLRRVVGMMAARADLPLDRLDDAVLIADVVAARAARYTLDAVQVRLCPGEHTLWMRIGPLVAGGADALLEAATPDTGSIISKLADEVEVDASGDGSSEYLRVRLAYGG